MNRLSAALFSVCAGLLLCGSAGAARLIPNWPYDKLMKDADLVVVAVPVSAEAADDATPEHHAGWRDVFAAQNTKFKVVHALKGKADGASIKVLHFRYDWGKEPRAAAGPADGGVRQVGHQTADAIMENGPSLVSFGADAVAKPGDGERKIDRGAEHLLFLKKLKDGRYEPVSGWIDLSVRVLAKPPRDNEQRK